MEIQQKFITSNNQGDKQSCVPYYIVIHDTGNSEKGAGALNHYKWLNNHNDLKRSAHIFVDDKTALQVIPYDRTSYHTGKLYQAVVNVPQCKNENSVGIEFCINADGNLTQTLENLLDVVVQVQQLFHIPVERVITHQMSSGKSCPQTFVTTPKLWKKFKADLAAIHAQHTIFQQAVQNIHQAGIINSPLYWQKQTNLNVQNLIINMSNYLKKRGKD